jgi:hypothetical protein
VEAEPLPQAGRQDPATQRDQAPRQLDDRDTGFEDPW